MFHGAGALRRCICSARCGGVNEQTLCVLVGLVAANVASPGLVHLAATENSIVGGSDALLGAGRSG